MKTITARFVFADQSTAHCAATFERITDMAPTEWTGNTQRILDSQAIDELPKRSYGASFTESMRGFANVVRAQVAFEEDGEWLIE